MKRFVFLFILLFLLTGCMGGGNLLTEKSAPANFNNFDNNEFLNQLDRIKNGAAPKVSPDKDSSLTPPPMQNQQKPSQTQSSSRKEVQLKDLASQFQYAVLRTNFGDIKLSFYADDAPIAVNNFLNLAQEGFYDGTKFHRVIKDFMIQGGDPNSKDDDWSNDGMGGPGYKFKDEINDHPLQRGSLAMANSGPNTNGSQFFIVTADFTPWLDGKYTNFGQVEEGMDTVDKIEALKIDANDHPLDDAVVKSIELR